MTPADIAQMVNSDPRMQHPGMGRDRRAPTCAVRVRCLPRPPRVGRQKFTAAADHAEQVDTESVPGETTEWDEDAEEETWDDEAPRENLTTGTRMSRR